VGADGRQRSRNEPISGLDRATARRLLEDVLATNGGRSLVYVTHHHEELDAFDDVLMIEGGRATGVRPRPPGTFGVEVVSEATAGRALDRIGRRRERQARHERVRAGR
jgi:ABC-type multidrug transport system ATPase subunit